MSRKRRRGYRYIDARGYVRIYEPDHPLAFADGSLFEHRKIAWEAGLLTDPDFQVHHRNGVKDDNNIENLEVLDAVEHGYHHGPPFTLTAAEASEIRWRRLNGESVLALVRAFRVGRALIYQVLGGKQWPDEPPREPEVFTAKPEREDVEHGSASTWVNHACRCEPCCEAHRVYMRAYHVRRRSLFSLGVLSPERNAE